MKADAQQQHTPGIDPTAVEWFVSDEHPRFVIQHEGVIGMRAVAVTAGVYARDRRVADLLGASTDLLAACRVFVAKYRAAPDGILGVGLVNEDFFRAEAAIRKAEGRAPVSHTEAGTPGGERARTRIADEIGVMPEELDEDPALLRLTGITYRDGVATLGPLMFCLTERDGSIGVWVNEDSAPDGPALASGDNVTDALWNLLHKSAVPA